MKKGKYLNFKNADYLCDLKRTPSPLNFKLQAQNVSFTQPP